MTKEEFYNNLSEGDVEVSFIKKTDGTKRVMKCTKNAPVGHEEEKHNRASMPETLITVFDTENQGWRSFYADSIIEVKPLNTTFGLLQE